MDLYLTLIGDDLSLNSLQMTVRSILVFFYGLMLIRLSGRRSFGLRAPFDNIILILLGAILAKAIAGTAPFIPTLVASLVLCLLHRLIAYLALFMPSLAQATKGKKVLLYEKGVFKEENMKRSLVTEGEILESIRLRTHTSSLKDIDTIFIERNGEISIIKHENKN